MTPEQIAAREVIARAIAPAGCDCSGFGGGPNNTCGCWVSDLHIADAALSALRSAGYAVVPVEATQDMMAAGQNALRGMVHPWPVRLLPAWRAMLAAARGAGGSEHG